MEGFVGWPEDVAARYRASGLWEGVTIGEMFARSARRSPDKLALVQGEQRLTYAELFARSRDRAARLAGLGLRSEDLVLMQLPNTIEFVVSYLALNIIGVIPVMALRAHRHAEVRHFLRASGATAYLIPDVVGSFDFRAMATEMQAEFPALKHVLVAGDPAPGQLALASLPDAPAPVNGPRPGEVSTMLLSGGTTSLSKLIPRTHDDYVSTRASAARGRLQRSHGAHGDPAARAQLQSRLSGHAGDVLLWRHCGARPRKMRDDVFSLIQREQVTVVAAVYR